MGYVNFKNGETTEFHVGIPMTFIEPSQIIFIQLDGDELDAVYEIIPQMIFVKRRVVRYYGEMAQFVMYNVFMH